MSTEDSSEVKSSTPSFASISFKKRRKRDTNVRARDTTPIASPADTESKQSNVTISEENDQGEEVPVAQAGEEERIEAPAEEEQEPESLLLSTSRKLKKPRKDNPLVSSTRQKLNDVASSHSQTYGSNRSVVPEKRSVADQITVEVEKQTRDPNLPKWKGPMKQSSNVRAISRFDYQPDVCKDYKETGYCSFGDSCKFMHDRGDYKSGWQLEREWDEEQKRKRMGGGGGDDEDYTIKEEEELPWACLICRGEFVNPVVTKCGHYFCESCAIKRYAKGQTKCIACNAQTNGIFNTATKIADNIAKRQELGLPLKPTNEEEEEEEEGGSSESRSSQAGWAIP